MTELEKQTLKYELMLRASNMSKREIKTEYECRNKSIHTILLKPIEWVQEGNSLYLWSESTGNGKTLGACTILKQYAKKISESQVYGRTPIYFVNLPQFLNEAKRDIGRSSEDRVIPSMMEKAKEADCVALDEIGSLKGLGAYEKDLLYEIIDYRTREMKATIYTSNSGPNILKKNLGSQLYSRVFIGSSCIEVMGEDKR